MVVERREMVEGRGRKKALAKDASRLVATRTSASSQVMFNITSRSYPRSPARNGGTTLNYVGRID